MGLVDDALRAYQQLEQTFQTVLLEKNLSWFGMLIVPSPRDDSTPLLSLDRKPYTDLILANTISVFDFRIYTLARQCQLLANLGRLNEVSHKTSAFLSAFGRRLREVQVLCAAVGFSYSAKCTFVEHATSVLYRIMVVFFRLERGRTV